MQGTVWMGQPNVHAHGPQIFGPIGVHFHQPIHGSRWGVKNQIDVDAPVYGPDQSLDQGDLAELMVLFRRDPVTNLFVASRVASLGLTPQRLGCAIRDYFDTHGEAAFRDVEEQVIDELTQGPALVLATGGGAVLRPANRQRLHERGTVIYLRSSPEQLFKRLRHDTKRPLLQVADPLQRLRDLYAERDPLYRECAHFVVDTHGSSLPMLVNRIMMQLDLMPPPAPPPPAP